MRWRRRSVSTRVLPDPAGAIIRGRAGAVGDGGQLVGSEVGGRGHVGRGRAPRRPSSTESACTTPAPSTTPSGARGPPSTHAGRPSASTTSAGPSGVASAPSRSALRAHHQHRVAVPGVVGVGPDEEVQPVDPRLEPRARASTARRPRSRGPGTIRDRPPAPRRRAGGPTRPRAAGRPPRPGSARVASSIRTTGAARHGPGTAPPSRTTTPRPSAAGPGTGTLGLYAPGVPTSPTVLAPPPSAWVAEHDTRCRESRRKRTASAPSGTLTVFEGAAYGLTISPTAQIVPCPPA